MAIKELNLKPTLRPLSSGKNAGPYTRSATQAFWVLMFPALFGLALFTAFPIAWGFLLSLSHAQNSIQIGHFVAFRNYTDLLTDPEFIKSLETICVFVVLIVPLTYGLSLGLAILVNNLGRGAAFFRSVIFIPSAVSYVAASLIWRISLFNGTSNGFFNHMLLALHVIHHPIAWIGTATPPWYWLVLVSARLWLQVGFYMIILLAGLQEIPKTLYEAASVDGAEGWRTVWYITLPQLKATTISVITLNLIAAFQAFDEFYNILGGSGASSGNIGLARPPLVYLYSIALGNENFGLGAAGGFILTAIIIGITLVQGRLFGFGESNASR